MKTIFLTKGFSTLVDDNDYEWLSLWKWHASISRSGVYAARSEKIGGVGKTIRMHRQLLNAHVNDIVDHINHNTLDNQKHNLRLCNKSQNGANQLLRTKGNVSYKGVHWCKRDKRWIAQIGKNGNRCRIGAFDSPEDAARAYDKAAIEYFGEFACLNFPKEWEGK